MSQQPPAPQGDASSPLADNVQSPTPTLSPDDGFAPSLVAEDLAQPSGGVPVPDAEDEVLDEEPKNIILGMISQLRKGADLSRITLPTFVLEPRSMCERITDFMCHPDFILSTPTKSDPYERFVGVLRFFLSGWHVKPKGVKKPYNPILGEIFRCKWKFEDQSESVYIAEQVSHHPPMSAYFYANPEHDVYILGDLRPKAKFLGNSAATIMQGGSTISFRKTYPGEEYRITMPNMYARGILFGTMHLELGDNVTVTCEKTGFIAELEFQIKGYFSGTYNGIKGKIKQRNSKGKEEVVAHLSGNWSETVYIQLAKSGSPKEVLFSTDKCVRYQKLVLPEAEQEEYESRLLWSKVTKALLSRDIDAATEYKTAIEDQQRVNVKAREEKKINWQPRFFHYNQEKDVYDLNIDPSYIDPQKVDPKVIDNNLTSIIFSSPQKMLYSAFWKPDLEKIIAEQKST